MNDKKGTSTQNILWQCCIGKYTTLGESNETMQ